MQARQAKMRGGFTDIDSDDDYDGYRSNEDEEDEIERLEGSIRVRVHFDRFGTNWDQEYGYDDFYNGKLLPLFSMTKHRTKVLNCKVYSRRESTTRDLADDSVRDDYILFGLCFNIQLIREWTLARSGAHALGQMSRFIKKEDVAAKESVKTVMNLLLEYDRRWIERCSAEERMTVEEMTAMNDSLQKVRERSER